jgi:hypothetical protein
MRHAAELAVVEEHLLWCRRCANRCEQISEYISVMRVALLAAGVAGGRCCWRQDADELDLS